MNNLEGYIAKDKSTLHIYLTNVKELHNLLSNEILLDITDCLNIRVTPFP